MQEDTVNDLKMIQEWFETNRVREAGIIENVKNQPASPERDEMIELCKGCLLYTSPSPRDRTRSRMPSSA